MLGFTRKWTKHNKMIWTSTQTPPMNMIYTWCVFHFLTGGLSKKHKAWCPLFWAFSKVPGILVTGKCTFLRVGFSTGITARLRLFFALSRTCCTSRNEAPFLRIRITKWHENGLLGWSSLKQWGLQMWNIGEKCSRHTLWWFLIGGWWGGQISDHLRMKAFAHPHLHQ